ncbi:MAG: 1-acyl-sn-glycerol-3-phosphate acyltransferase [Clostridia bacterium]|nr:1-acyl-sn-glycerol-3-phosphate acyltransferase [Clostridia bacterium]
MSKTNKARRIPKPKSGLYKVVKLLLTYPLRFLCNMKVRGSENEPTREEGAYLVIANHRTWADPIYLGIVLKHQQPHFMAKKELFKIPLLNILIRALGAYPVNRGGADVGAIKYTIEMLKAGVTVGMFPQGHRYNGVDPRKTSVKTGAAMIALKAGVPVLPVFIKVKNNKHFFLCRKEVIVGKPITPEEMSFSPEAPGEYQRVADYLFEKVCELGD